ncbi:MAG: UTP--glucose-1-phosphate uridylyltransferase [Acidobacteria bacterium]|nr:MAG: UTP--glucose-1-phosphate uridylyltransferase [Acidobacteriota bacterium]
MKVRKAVITAAGKNQRSLPLQTLIDSDGIQKSALRIIVEEALSAGVEAICVVVSPGDEESYREAAGDLRNWLHFVEQPAPKGYANAIACAREFTAHEPFLHLVGDHLYWSAGPTRCARQLTETAAAESCTVSAVQATRESMLPYYGTVGGRRVAGKPRLYLIENVIEKPTPTEAEQRLLVPGLRSGHYLCFFGMHVLTPAVMNLLEDGSSLSSALAMLAGKERCLAAEIEGLRYDIGVKYGLLTAQLALALGGKDREGVLAHLVELLASRELSQAGVAGRGEEGQ